MSPRKRSAEYSKTKSKNRINECSCIPPQETISPNVSDRAPLRYILLSVITGSTSSYYHWLPPVFWSSNDSTGVFSGKNIKWFCEFVILQILNLKFVILKLIFANFKFEFHKLRIWIFSNFKYTDICVNYSTTLKITTSNNLLVVICTVKLLLS